MLLNPGKLTARWESISAVWCLHAGNFSPFHCLSKGCCLAKALGRPMPDQVCSSNNPQRSQLMAWVLSSDLWISHFCLLFKVSNDHGGRAEGTFQQCTDELAYHFHCLEILSFSPQPIQCQCHSLGWGWQLAWSRGRKANKGSCPHLSSVVRQVCTIGSQQPSSIIRSTARVSWWWLIAEQMGMFHSGCWYSRWSWVWLKRGCCCWAGSANCTRSCTSCGCRCCWRGTGNKISIWISRSAHLQRTFWVARSIRNWSETDWRTVTQNLQRYEPVRRCVWGVITAKIWCCVMLFYYDLLDSSIGIMSSLFGIVNSICPFCILLCIYTFYYVLPLDNIRNCILLF